MTEAIRKKAGGKPPISRHPLFPVTVALWFGALFGLGSMAIKPSLIEQAVLAIGLPAIIPATEPPLGATMQLLLALTMAGAGGLFGAVLARRLGRPKVQTRARRRGAFPSASDCEDAVGFASRRGETGEADATESESLSRRRSLAIQEDARPQDFHEHAPLPGSRVQILDVTEFDLDGFEADRADPAQQFVSDDIAEQSPECRDGAEDREAIAFGTPDSAQVFRTGEEEPQSRPGSASSEAEFGQWGDDEREVDTCEGECDSQFALECAEASHESLACEPAQVFNRSPLFIRDDEGKQCDAGSAGGEDRANGSPFAAPSIQQIFSRPADLAESADDPGEQGNEADGLDEGSGAARAEQGDWTRPGKHGETRIQSSRIMNVSLGELSHAELLERLALTLERSRNRTPDAAPPLDVHSGAFAAATELAVLPVGHDGEETQLEDYTPQATVSFQAAQPPIPVIPAALRPIDFDDDADLDLLPSFIPPRHFSVAFQAGPTRLADAEEGTSDASESESESDEQLPLALPATEPETRIAAAADTAAADTELDDEERDLEQGYSSLLSLSRPDRQQFVRIEEPEDDDGEVKPFVVFPGEGAIGHGPFAKPLADRSGQPDQECDAADAPEDEVRRFDQPDNHEVSSGPGAVAVTQLDPEETERSLKAALATLQRMSGAA